MKVLIGTLADAHCSKNCAFNQYPFWIQIPHFRCISRTIKYNSILVKRIQNILICIPYNIAFKLNDASRWIDHLSFAWMHGNFFHGAIIIPREIVFNIIDWIYIPNRNYILFRSRTPCSKNIMLPNFFLSIILSVFPAIVRDRGNMILLVQH